MNKIRVILADDHQVVRQGMVALLNAQVDIEVIGEATDGLELIELVESLHPDVVLTDITMPKLNGVEAAAQIRKRFRAVKVVMLSMHTASSYVIRSLRSGALGYLLKSDDIENIVQAIRTVMEGKRYLSSRISEQIIDSYLLENENILDAEKHPTDRENEILQLLAEGNTNAQIAEKLNISPRTVETHRANIMTKLGLSSRADIVNYAIQHGLIPLSD